MREGGRDAYGFGKVVEAVEKSLCEGGGRIEGEEETGVLISGWIDGW